MLSVEEVMAAYTCGMLGKVREGVLAVLLSALGSGKKSAVDGSTLACSSVRQDLKRVNL